MKKTCHKIKRMFKWIWRRIPVTMGTHVDMIDHLNERIKFLVDEHKEKLNEVTATVQDLLKNHVEIRKNVYDEYKGEYIINIGISASFIESYVLSRNDRKEIIAKEISRKVYDEIMNSKFISTREIYPHGTRTIRKL